MVYSEYTPVEQKPHEKHEKDHLRGLEKSQNLRLLLEYSPNSAEQEKYCLH